MSDVMLLGVLRMPVPFPVDAMWLHQFVDRAREAADRIEADAAEIEQLRAELQDMHNDRNEWMRRWHALAAKAGDERQTTRHPPHYPRR